MIATKQNPLCELTASVFCVTILSFVIAGCSGKSSGPQPEKKTVEAKTAVLYKNAQNEVVAAEFVKTALATEHVAALGEHAKMKEITFYECQGFSEKNCDELAKLKGIVAVHFIRSRIDDAGLGRLNQMTSVAHLSLTNTEVTSKGISALKNWKNLKRLALKGRIKPKALGGLSDLDQLETLEIALEGFEPRQLFDCAFPNIRTLSIPELEISDEDLSSLPAWKTLEVFEFLSGKVTDDGVAHFKKFSSLKKLVLSNSKITNAALGELAQLKKLEELTLNGCKKITNPGLEKIAEMPVLNRLLLDNSGVTGEGLLLLGTSKNLRYVGISETQASKAEVAKLASLLPKCRVDRIQLIGGPMY